MDESFLSDEQLVAVSRDFVCLRLATYENAREAEFLKGIFAGRRTGELENTVFAILTPDGKEKLSRPGRSPSFAFRDATAMTSWMKNLLADEYPDATALRFSDKCLPLTQDVRVGLNMAACDQSLMLITVGIDGESQRQLQERLRKTAWSEGFAGQLIYAATNQPRELAPLEGDEMPETGVLLVKPGEYGLSGKILATFPGDFDELLLQDRLRTALRDYNPLPKHDRSHIALASHLGLEWKTAIPVTDEHSLKAQERWRKK